MVKRFVIVIVALLVLIAVAYVLYPSARDEASGLSRATIGDVAEQPVLDIDGLTAKSLDSNNTTVGFSCAKTVAGKTLVVRGGWSGKFGSAIRGNLGLDPESNLPQWLDAQAKIDSVWSEHDQLTEALLTTGFFRPEDHPWATFQGAFIYNGDADVKVAGAFTLNGISKHLEFPVTVQPSQDTLIITSEFSIDRHVFDVEFKKTGAFGLLLTNDDIADLVAVHLRIEVSLEDEPASEALAADSDSTTETDSSSAGSPDVAVDSANWPGEFTDTIPVTQVSFNMVLVPAAPGSNNKPFYMGKHEVTWDEFMPWVQGKDLADEAQIGEERAMKLRPSSPYGTVDRNFGMYRRPALGMSRLAAELYCQWLSKQTGRTYRLPTEAEWDLAYTAGGGDPTSPPDAQDVDRIATYYDNSWDDGIGDWATSLIGQREPNALGVYDLAGNVAEWVTGTGDEHVVRGGHFESPLEDLVVGRIVEDQDVWNRDYPNDPKSQWWYVNARWVGFRLVCEMPPEP